MDAGLSLVIPAYNESAVIRSTLRDAEEALDAHFPQFEILVVDDGSSDDTATLAAEQFPLVRVLRHGVNRGYGAALRTGFAAARYDLVAFTDADGQFDLHDLGTLARLADSAPIVVGYREQRQDPARRRFLSWGYNWLARTMIGTGVRDCDCALKVFRREVLADLLPESRGFFVNTEILARAHQLGHRVLEHPVRHRPRVAGTSKVSLREIPRTLRALLGFWWQQRIGSLRGSQVVADRVRVPGTRATTVPVPGPPVSS